MHFSLRPGHSDELVSAVDLFQVLVVAVGITDTLLM